MSSDDTSSGQDPWVFGLAPLDQTRDVAQRLRRVAGLVQALEHPTETVGRLIDDLESAERELEQLVSPEPTPRVGDEPPDHLRPYLDHGVHVGAYNPCFPEYDIEVDGQRASGTVTFPIVYEGPPGIVHGGVQATFFDCVIQHHHCLMGQAGKTATLNLRYRRPVPLATPLRFTVERVVDDHRITSTAELLNGDEVLTIATMEAVSGVRANLPRVSPRRS